MLNVEIEESEPTREGKLVRRQLESTTQQLAARLRNQTLSSVRPCEFSSFGFSFFFHCAAMTLCNVVVLVYWLLGVVVRSLCFSVLHLQRVAHVMSAAASAFAVFACVFFQPLLRAAARAPLYMPYTRRSERCVSVFG